MRHLRSVLALAALPLAAACGDGGPAAPKPDPVPPAVASVIVDPPAADLAVGDSVQLRATLRDSLGREITGRAVVWRSPDSLLVTVSSTGLARVVRNQPGETFVLAESEGRTGRATLRVQAPAPGRLAQVRVVPSLPSLAVGGTRQLRAWLYDVNFTPLADRPAQWTSSDPAVLAVSDSGVVRGVGPGTATVSAVVEGVQARITLVVDRGYKSTLVPLASPWDLNDEGEVVGDDRGRVVVWKAGAVRRGPSAFLLGRLAINSRGEVAGSRKADAASRWRGFLWSGDRVREIAPPDTAADVVVQDVNATGQVVGYWGRCSNLCPEARAFLWENGTFLDLGALAGTSARADGINDAGVIVATAEKDTAAFGRIARVVVLQGGVRTELGTGRASAIGSRADVVGTRPGGALIWRGGQLSTVASSRGQTAEATSISADGEATVVVAGASSFEGLLWRSGRVVPLAGLVVDLDSTPRVGGYRINDRGQILATVGVSAGFETRTYLLTPLPR